MKILLCLHYIMKRNFIIENYVHIPVIRYLKKRKKILIKKIKTVVIRVKKVYLT